MILLLTRRMNGLAAALLALGACTALAAQVPHMDRSEAALLYETHCQACHSAQIHWRERRLVKDWPGLVAQVRRWQGNLGLGWSDDEIRQVAHHLNLLYYRFAPGAPRLLVRAGSADARPARLAVLDPRRR